MPSRKSPAKLDRDIEARVGKYVDRKKLAGLMFPWGSDFSYGQGSGAIGAVASYYSSDKKYPDRVWVERALKQIETDIPRAKRGEAGWTKSDVRELRTIAQGLRYYLLHDYNGGHSTKKEFEKSRKELVDVAREAAASVFAPRKVAPSDAVIKKARSVAFRAIQRHDPLSGTSTHPVAAYAHGIAELAAEGTEEARQRWEMMRESIRNLRRR